MRGWRFFSAGVVVLALLLLSAGRPAAADRQAVIDELVVANSARELLVYFRVAGAFGDRMQEAVQSGLPLVFSFVVRLERVRPRWPDEEIVERAFDHVLTYDALKDEYTVVCEEEGKGRRRTFRRLDEAAGRMARVSGLALVGLDRLSDGEDYLVAVRARLGERSLPFRLHYLLPFFSQWDFETPWRRIRFRY